MSNELDKFLNIAAGETLPAVIEKKITTQANADFEFARENMMEVINKGQEALFDLMDVAKQSQHPRAYEVLANTIKTLAEINVNLMDVSAKFAETNKVNVKNTTNNSIFVGTTKDLQKLLKKENNFVEGELNEQPAKRLSSQSES